MSDSLDLRIGCIFILCVISFVGILIPLKVPQGIIHSDLFCLVKSCAAGVMLGLCLIHLMPEANERLLEVVPDYPLSYALTGVGVMTVLFIEQLSLAYTSKNKEEALQHFLTLNMEMAHVGDAESGTQKDPNEDGGKVDNDFYCENHSAQHDVMYGHDHSHSHHSCGGHDHSHSHSHQVQSYQSEHSPTVSTKKNEKKAASLSDKQVCESPKCHTHTHDHDHGAMALKDVMDAKDMRSILTAYTLEVSTAIHSIIIGVGLGALTDKKEISVLLAALCFHQFMEGIGLGSVLASSRDLLSSGKIISFVAIFSLVVPIGVMIGIVSSSQEGDAQLLVQGILTSLAAGAMLYSALIEMTAHVFNHHDIESRVGLKSLMLLSYFAGYAIMAGIGVWA